ncbi:hypothetical protein OAK38_06155 [Verrucomicrobia bacterium]|nr:hypothetical protein [Verrucomicrobiota bacterium]
MNSMGAGGSKYINNTGAHAGEFTSIQFTEDSVLSAYTGEMENSSALITDATVFSQGQVLYGPFTSVTLASGAAIVYKK